MTLDVLLARVKAELESRDLVQPGNRKDAINRITKFIKTSYRYLSPDGSIVLPTSPELFKENYRHYKGHSISGSEENVIKLIFSKYNNSALDSSDHISEDSKSDLFKKPIIYIDLFSGRWVKTKIGHECRNFEWNSVGQKYYGYCPPGKNIFIERLGAESTEDYADGVIVVYTQKISDNNSDREIIAFIDNARVYREHITDKKLKRTIKEDNKTVHCAYSIVSDSIYDLRSSPTKHVIHLNGHNIFRNQRIYKDDYPQIDKRVLAYLENHLRHSETDDDSTFQNQVFKEEEYSSHIDRDNSRNKPEYNRVNGSITVVKNPKVSKSALYLSGFKCAVDPSHKTFISSKGVQYMEGHHLIPCTYSNASRIWGKRKRNIDCKENIVCLCPTCHRRVHFGSDEEKRSILRLLYNHQIKKLKSAGLELSFEDLLGLYL